MHEYTRSQTAVANLPYVAMVLLGSATIAYACGFSAWALGGAGAYLFYGAIGALWIMVFVCPYCAHYSALTCPCGYGRVSARIVKRGDRTCFSEKFKRHIPVIVPLWLIPLACGGIALLGSFSWGVVGLVSTFAVEAFLILPLVSRRHACAECPQKSDCPWMGARPG